MTRELRYLLKTNGDCEARSDQESLCALLTDLRAVGDDVYLDLPRRLSRPELFRSCATSGAVIRASERVAK
jgi:hypothetical protein